MTKHYSYRKVYISIESKFKHSEVKEIKKYIDKQLMKQNPWIKHIILRSHLMTDNESKNCKNYYEKFCKKYNATCKKEKAKLSDKIATKSIEIYNNFLNTIGFSKTEKINIPKYKYVGLCIIDTTKKRANQSLDDE